jgi:hypothetical protein
MASVCKLCASGLEPHCLLFVLLIFLQNFQGDWSFIGKSNSIQMEKLELGNRARHVTGAG